MEVDTRTQEEIFRFTQDLEFVQLLSNPAYLDCKNIPFNNKG
jgi:hypothetical protein